MSSPTSIAAAALLALAGSIRAADAAAGLDWPQFRGRNAAGVAEGASPPAVWDAEKGTNVRWRTPIPGLAHASPVVARGRVFIVTAVTEKEDPQLRVGLYGDIASVQDDSRHSWRLFALDRASGKVVWEKTLREGVPRIKRHTKSSHANSTPATDGERVVVFLGSEGLLCLDLEGKLLWEKDLGVLDAGFYRMPAAQWAFGSSPVIHGDTVIVQCDVQRDSFIAAFRLKDGSEKGTEAVGDIKVHTETVSMMPEAGGSQFPVEK